MIIEYPILNVILDQTTAKSDYFGVELPYGVEEYARQFASSFGHFESHQKSVVVTKNKTHTFVGLITTTTNTTGELSTNQKTVFRWVLIPEKEYWQIDPFSLAATIEKADLRASTVGCQVNLPAVPRLVSEIADLLKNNDSPLILGATQYLLDGGKILLPMEEATENIIQQVWMILPDRSRSEFTFATLIPKKESLHNLALDCSLLATRSDANHGNISELEGDKISNPLSKQNKHFDVSLIKAEQLRTYPNGRFEQELLLAAENGDQVTVNKLMQRKTGNEMLRFSIYLLVIIVGVILVSKFIK